MLIDVGRLSIGNEDLTAELNRGSKNCYRRLDFTVTAYPMWSSRLSGGRLKMGAAACCRLVPDPAFGMVTNIRSRAVKWAYDRAAEMVGMTEPCRRMANHGGTREMIRAQVVEAAKRRIERAVSRSSENFVAFTTCVRQTIA